MQFRGLVHYCHGGKPFLYPSYLVAFSLGDCVASFLSPSLLILNQFVLWDFMRSNEVMDENVFYNTRPVCTLPVTVSDRASKTGIRRGNFLQCVSGWLMAESVIPSPPH